MKIIEAMSTWPPALLLLRESGCALRADHDESNETSTWMAEIGSTTLIASSPVALLGLYTLWKAKGEGWASGAAGGTVIYDQLLEGGTVPPLDSNETEGA